MDRTVLVDNSTLSGVERITGKSQTRNLNYIDNDILCLEKLVTAILFSDELIGIDDYKNEYRSNRLKNFDFINFIRCAPETYDELAKDAASFAKSMTFSFEESKPAGDVVEFFETLRITPQLRWDIFVSSEYLTLSYLVAEINNKTHETAVDSVLRNEITDRDHVSTETDHTPMLGVDSRSDINAVKDIVAAFKSQNPRFAGGDEIHTLNRMIFGYGWAAERAYLYNAIGEILGADTYLAPLRDAFCESCCRIDYKSQTAGLLQSLKDNSQHTLASILTPSGQAMFATRLPFFTAYLISKTATPQDCISSALELRNHKDFQDCRTIFHNLQHLSQADKTKELNGILKYLDQSYTNLMKEYSVSTKSGLISSLGIGITGPSIGLKLDYLFRRYKNKPFARVFRNIAQEMSNVEKLGSLHDKLTSSIRKHNDASHPKISATPAFMENKESEHGRPAKL